MKIASSHKYKSLHLHLLYHYVFAVTLLLTFFGVAFYWETMNVMHQADVRSHATFQHFLTHDRRVFMAILFFGALISLFAGVMITRRGLRSLSQMTETVRNITSSSLGERIDPATLPRELFGLGLAFNQMLGRIEDSFSRLKQMSADMSHELRTPIMNLIGQTEWMLSSSQVNDDYRSAQASNLEELQRMASIIENILFLARAENPQTELAKQDVDLGNEVDSVCEYYQAVADEKNIQMERHGGATIRVAQIMFKRLMSNVISNALKYTPDNGTVTVDIRDHDKDHILITVEDSGVGISAEHLPKLFDRFYRVDSSRSTDARGSGLGLAIVKSIVAMHHGSIQAISKPGVGTKIEIILCRVG